MYGMKSRKWEQHHIRLLRPGLLTEWTSALSSRCWPVLESGRPVVSRKSSDIPLMPRRALRDSWQSQWSCCHYQQLYSWWCCWGDGFDHFATVYSKPCSAGWSLNSRSRCCQKNCMGSHRWFHWKWQCHRMQMLPLASAMCQQATQNRLTMRIYELSGRGCVELSFQCPFRHWVVRKGQRNMKKMHTNNDINLLRWRLRCLRHGNP